MNQKRYFNQIDSMVQFILEGHSEIETADEFGISISQVLRRLKMIGYTFADLVEIRKETKKGTS